MNAKPSLKPNNPLFSSGPCPKRPGWNLAVLSNAILGRSHRSKKALDRINKVISLIKETLNIPSNYHVGIVPASDTGAIEMLLWNLLGKKPVDVLAWESFGNDWVKDIVNQLIVPNTRVLKADYGEIVDLSQVNFNNDVVFTWNGTTSGVCVPDADWIEDDREGLTICDATSAVFSMNLPWHKLDATTFSWQKVLGGEAQHGVIVLSPKVVYRLESFKAERPIPKIFQLMNKSSLNKKLFLGSTINTPSMLCIEDVLDSLTWVKKIGGLKKTIELSNKNLSVVEKKIKESSWLDFLAKDKKVRSCTSICLKIKTSVLETNDQEILKNNLSALLDYLEENNIAHDIGAYRDAPRGIRIWGGATVNYKDIDILLDWLEWGYHEYIKKEN
ncbi:MAG: phosphoserine transaminase [Pelagibacterales bacterium]|nr:phosphoserine transaminase [Pelagibacterales bacterium]|tara:strand:- start:9844 stop:11004 length:1161 start_codon:yes stop_codon:yes gene_type:complete